MNMPLKSLRSHLIAWLEQQPFNFTCTLTLDKKYASRERASALLKAWDNQVNRALFGRNHAGQTNPFNWFAFFELEESNPHYHLVGFVDEAHKERFNAEAARIWEKLTRNKQTLVEPFLKADGWLHYITKERNQIENMVFSREFKTSSAPVGAARATENQRGTQNG